MQTLWRLLVPFSVLTLGLHLAIWGWPSGSGEDWISATLLMLGVYLVAVVVHEVLHVLPMFAAGIKPSELSFGIRWREGVAYVHGGRPVSARAYRVILATPGLVLGAVPLFYGLVIGSAFATVFGYLMTLSAVGDWAVWRLIRDLEPDRLVEDHETAIGCVVLPRERLV